MLIATYYTFLVLSSCRSR